MLANSIVCQNDRAYNQMQYVTSTKLQSHDIFFLKKKSLCCRYTRISFFINFKSLWPLPLPTRNFRFLNNNKKSHPVFKKKAKRKEKNVKGRKKIHRKTIPILLYMFIFSKKKNIENLFSQVNLMTHREEHKRDIFQHYNMFQFKIENIKFRLKQGGENKIQNYTLKTFRTTQGKLLWNQSRIFGTTKKIRRKKMRSSDVKLEGESKDFFFQKIILLFFVDQI